MGSVRVRVGIDIGGTFTDLVLVNGESVHIAKVLTTHKDPARGALNGFQRVLDVAGVSASSAETIVHATTLVTNALIERSGATVGLITNRGFTDSLEIAREKRFDLYDIFLEIPPPLVSRDMCAGVSERVDADGKIISPVDEGEVAAAAGELHALGVTSLAINFLHASANPENEIAAEAVVKERFPEMWVSRSSAVAPEIGEYERCSTTAANAFVQPVVAQYLDRLAASLEGLGFEGNLSIMLSTGGFARAKGIRNVPIRIVESGPAGGALAAGRVARICGEKLAIGFDMGGTTAKICLIRDFEPDTVNVIEVARTSRFQKGSGLPILSPSIDLVEIGAGGGSIAHVNRMGLVQVGPQSAGSEPGPACYGRGGERPTVTDANLLLGYLNPEYFLGGEMSLSTELARKTLEALADELGLELEEAAWGVHDIVTEQMVSAARVHIAEKGADPRQFVLIATGGAGPAHACHMASKLHMSRVVCPPAVGVASAIGLLTARARSDAARAYVANVDEIDWGNFSLSVEEMKKQAFAEMGGGAGAEGWESTVLADMRYRGQVGTLTVPLAQELGSTPGDGELLRSRFEEAYLLRYRRKIEDVPVEVAAWRLTVLGPLPEGISAEISGAATGDQYLKGRRRMFDGRKRTFTEGAIYDRYHLPEAERFSGPAVIEERESTIVVSGEATFFKDKSGNIHITMES